MLFCFSLCQGASLLKELHSCTLLALLGCQLKAGAFCQHLTRSNIKKKKTHFFFHLLCKCCFLLNLIYVSLHSEWVVCWCCGIRAGPFSTYSLGLHHLRNRVLLPAERWVGHQLCSADGGTWARCMQFQIELLYSSTLALRVPPSPWFLVIFNRSCTPACLTRIDKGLLPGTVCFRAELCNKLSF